MFCEGSETRGHGLAAYHVFESLRCLINDMLASAPHESVYPTENKEWERAPGFPPLCTSDFLEEKTHELHLSSSPILHEPHSFKGIMQNSQNTEAFPPSSSLNHSNNSDDKVLVKVTELCPKVFRAIRYLSGVTKAVFASEWLPLATVRMSLGSGRSNSLFFSSKSRLFLCKTIAVNEVCVLQRILPSYIEHLQIYPNSFLTRFFLVMKVEVKNDVGLIICFQDVCANAPRIHEKWDLKGRIPKPGKFDGSFVSDGLPDGNLFEESKKEDKTLHRKKLHRMGNENDFSNSLENIRAAKNNFISMPKFDVDGPRTSLQSVTSVEMGSGAQSPIPREHVLDVSRSHLKNAETTHGQSVSVRKDKNLTRLFWLEPSVRKKVLQQLQVDYDYLASVGLMDYSLFIAVCRKTKTYNASYLSTIYCTQSFSEAVEERRPSTTEFPLGGFKENNAKGRRTSRKFEVKKSEMEDGAQSRRRNQEERNPQTSFVDNLSISSLHSAVGEESQKEPVQEVDLRRERQSSRISIIPSAALHNSRFNQGIIGLCSQEVYYVGIIDMLTEYTFAKMVANFFKSFLWKTASLSTIPPIPYRQRIMQFSRVAFPSINVNEDDIPLPSDE